MSWRDIEVDFKGIFGLPSGVQKELFQSRQALGL